MRRQLSLLTASRFDVLVIGGGVHGLAIAYDAAARGLTVALIDRGDFGAAASFNHAKTVHGGLRSLQTGDLVKARFSVHERRAMARIAPNLVTPLPFMMATTRKLSRSRIALRAGFALDAMIGFDRNVGVPAALRLPAGRVLPPDEYRRVFGGNAVARTTGAARWFDYQMPESDRLTLAFAQAAVRAGAVLANHVEAVSAVITGQRVRGVVAVDGETGASLEISARLTVNAAGAFARPWAEALGGAPNYPLIRAMNVVTARPAGPVALGAPTSGGRLLLVMPWKGRALIGTSHSEEPVEPGAAVVSDGELAAFLGDANSAFPDVALTPSDVTLVHRGVVPARRDRRGVLSLMAHHVIRDHARDGMEGAVTVVGVKYTTARGVAEQAVDLAQAKLGHALSACRTGTSRLPGSDFDNLASEVARADAEAAGLIAADLLAALVATHGTEWREVVNLCRSDESLALPVAGGAVLRSTVVHAVRSEMARTLTDVVVRRTGLGAAGYPGDAVAHECARLVAAELGWDDERTASEIGRLRDFYAPVTPGSPSEPSR